MCVYLLENRTFSCKCKGENIKRQNWMCVTVFRILSHPPRQNELFWKVMQSHLGKPQLKTASQSSHTSHENGEFTCLRCTKMCVLRHGLTCLRYTKMCVLSQRFTCLRCAKMFVLSHDTSYRSWRYHAHEQCTCHDWGVWPIYIPKLQKVDKRWTSLLQLKQWSAQWIFILYCTCT